MKAALAAAFLCLHPGAVDGDTLRCGDGTRVRIWGIQAPERHHPEGPASTLALSRLIAGKNLTCIDKGQDRYRRTVALCTVDGRDVAAEMVRQKRAADWPRYSGGYYGGGRP
jgi:micrococcal nuclease